MTTTLSAATLEAVQQTVVPLEYSVVVQNVFKIRKDLLKDKITGLESKVKVCWVRKARVIETPAVAVSLDGTADFDGYILKMIARMDYDKYSRSLTSKVT